MLVHISLGVAIGIILFNLYILRNNQKHSKRLADNKKQIYQIVEMSKDIIYYLEIKPERRFTYISPSIEKILGCEIIEEGYKNPYICFEFIHPDDHEILEKKISGDIDYNKPILQRLRNHQGEYIWFEEYTTPVYENGELVALQGIIRNVHDEMKLQEDLEYRLTHDCLTQIYNRSYFDKQMEIYNHKKNAPAAIILCDLDELKCVNDKYGHRQGDKLIIEAAKLLNTYSAENVVVARIGGDEFAILLTNETRPFVEQFFANISKGLEAYNELSLSLNIKMSKGYAYSHHSLNQMEALFTEADQNMYKEKNSKKELCFS